MDDESAGLRLDVFLSELDDPPLSRSQVKKRLDRGEITVNGNNKKAGYVLRAGDSVAWRFEPEILPSTEPEDLNIDVLLETDDFAFVNKPVGMVVHPSPGHPSGTLVNALAYHFNELSNDPIRPGIVHRIDKDTSGVLVVAKNDDAHQRLGQLFHDHDIDREYVAIVWGPKLPAKGTFVSTHARDPKNRLRFTGRTGKGRNAITHYEVVEELERHHKLVRCRLETGRTHQIRMHFYENDTPLIGDTLYGFKNTVDPKLIHRHALHARSLGFAWNGENVFVESELPDDFSNALKQLKI